MDPSLVALDEVVVVGYGTEKRTGITEGATVVEMNNDVPDYTEPMPIGGFDNFRDYIDSNLRFPDDHPESKRAVVVLKFSVGPDHRPMNIKVLRSPGTDFSDEAVRLLKNGPGWNRATMKGSPIDVETQIRIVFKNKESD